MMMFRLIYCYSVTRSLSLICVLNAALRVKNDNQYVGSASVRLESIREQIDSMREDHSADSASTSLTALSAIPSCDKFFAADDTACKISYTINRQTKEKRSTVNS